MAIISRKQLDKVELQTELVDVPEWRTSDQPVGEIPQVWVRELMGDERNAYEASMLSLTGRGKKMEQTLKIDGATVRLAQMGLINPDGTQMYSKSREDIAALGKLPAKGLERVCGVIMRLSGITQEDQSELEELAANFQKAEMNGSGIS